MHKNRVSNS